MCKDSGLSEGPVVTTGVASCSQVRHLCVKPPTQVTLVLSELDQVTKCNKNEVHCIAATVELKFLTSEPHVEESHGTPCVSGVC